MIKDILVVLTVTSAIVVIGLALFNRPARSAEWAVLPPIEYDKPYANISIWEDTLAYLFAAKLRSHPGSKDGSDWSHDNHAGRREQHDRDHYGSCTPRNAPL